MDDLIGTIIMLVMFVVVPMVIKAAKGKIRPAPAPRPSLPRSAGGRGQTRGKGSIDLSFLEDALESLGIELPAEAAAGSRPDRPLSSSEETAARRRELVDESAALKDRAVTMEETVMHEPPNRRFLTLLRQFVPAELERARKLGADPVTLESAIAGIEATNGILDVIDVLAEQRRNAEMAQLLGDADRLAEACYLPIVAFARENRLPLQSNDPVTYFGDFDLAIWTGFIPTSVAPLFLPRAFFRRLAWWPAIAHEIGHDFLASMTGLNEGLRADLGLPSEAEGRRPLRTSAGAVPAQEIRRVFGVWFEELFCDVFGALMVGPAYVASMLELALDPESPRRALAVALDPDGQAAYDLHPPAHLRFLVSCSVLDRVGIKKDITAIKKEWSAGLEIDGQPPEALFFPGGRSYFPLPIEPFVDIGVELAMKLYLGPLKALGFSGLRDIVGLDYGPHRHGAAQLSRQQLLAGEVPEAADPRAIICGAVMAAREDPSREQEIMNLARGAIPAVGTYESRSGFPGKGTERKRGATLTSELVDAVVLGAILGPSRPAR